MTDSINRFPVTIAVVAMMIFQPAVKQNLKKPDEFAFR